MLKRGEEAYGSFSVSLLKEHAIREFRAGTSSVSIPLGHGVRYRIGGIRGRSVVVGTEQLVEDTGLLTVTNQRVVFTGRAKTLEFRNDRLIGLEQFTDGLRLNVSNRQTASLFKLSEPSIAQHSSPLPSMPDGGRVQGCPPKSRDQHNRALQFVRRTSSSMESRVTPSDSSFRA